MLIKPLLLVCLGKNTGLRSTDVTSGIILDFCNKQLNALCFAYISMKIECMCSLFDKLDFV